MLELLVLVLEGEVVLYAVGLLAAALVLKWTIEAAMGVHLALRETRHLRR